MDCPAALIAGRAGSPSCAATELDFKKLRKGVKKALNRGDVVSLAEFDWIDLGNFVEKRFFFGRELFVVRFSESAGILAVLPDASCHPATVSRAKRRMGSEAPIRARCLTRITTARLAGTTCCARPAIGKARCGENRTGPTVPVKTSLPTGSAIATNPGPFTSTTMCA